MNIKKEKDMKRVKNYALLIMIALGMSISFASCSDDDEDNNGGNGGGNGYVGALEKAYSEKTIIPFFIAALGEDISSAEQVLVKHGFVKQENQIIKGENYEVILTKDYDMNDGYGMSLVFEVMNETGKIVSASYYYKGHASQWQQCYERNVSDVQASKKLIPSPEAIDGMVKIMDRDSESLFNLSERYSYEGSFTSYEDYLSRASNMKPPVADTTYSMIGICSSMDSTYFSGCSVQYVEPREGDQGVAENKGSVGYNNFKMGKNCKDIRN